MNRCCLQLSVIILFLPVSDQGDEHLSPFIKAAAGVILSPPRDRFLDGREMALMRDLVEGGSFRGHRGIPVTDVVA